jgi:hypothetical protein
VRRRECAGTIHGRRLEGRMGVSAPAHEEGQA